MQDWIKTKAALLSTYTWLPALRNDQQTLDGVIFDAATSASSVPCPYDPYRVERLLSDVSRLLDRLFCTVKKATISI